MTFTCDETQPLSKDEVAKLHAAYKAGDDSAGWRLVLSQRGWMLKIVSKNVKDSDALEDALSELSIIVHRALRTYDPGKGRLSTFVYTVWNRRRERILPQCLLKESITKTVNLGPVEPDVPETVDSDQGSVLEELVETTAISEQAKLAFQLRARGSNRTQIAMAIDREFPEYFARLQMKTKSPRELHVRELIQLAASHLGEQFGMCLPKQEQQDTPEVNDSPQPFRPLAVKEASNELFASVIRILLEQKSVNAKVRAIRRLGMRISHSGLYSLLKRFSIAERIKAIQSGENMEKHVDEITAQRHLRPKVVRTKKEPRPAPVLRELTDDQWQQIRQILPANMLELPRIRERVAVLIQKAMGEVTWTEAVRLVAGGNLRAMYETLQDFGILPKIVELAQPL